ncbi:DUF726-domain-containing protein [Dipodascopsis tothii]|uniref:DUF726-domain-containing protein n=1 Tax=Dipodascopsis tothii TaxID=44089 RepID=UPI0034CE13C7
MTEPTLDRHWADDPAENGAKTGTANWGLDGHDTTAGLDAQFDGLSVASEWSRQLDDGTDEPTGAEDDGGWNEREMPAFASYDMYDDDGKLVAREEIPSEDDDEENERRGGAGKGYTRIRVDEAGADRAAKLDTETRHLFFDKNATELEARNPSRKMETTKEMLNDTQKIAYVGLCKLAITELSTRLAHKRGSDDIGRQLSFAQTSMAMWGHKTMGRLYAHMDISEAERAMVERLAQHGVESADLAPALMQNARVHNPLAGDGAAAADAPLPAFSAANRADQYVRPLADVHDESIDIDVRWTVLCDLFLVLVSESVYDARSRTLLEHVGAALAVDWLDISKFEKRLTDALDVDEGSYQIWKEDDLVEARRKRSLRKKYMYMGMATVGGGLIIGLSAGLLAPVIGAGVAAGLTTVGIAGTSSFLAGTGGAAMVTTTAAAVGAHMGHQGMGRRMGHVRTFEFRPLHNENKVNLIVTVSGWLSGKEDDVRLPFSTVDPIMGDLYSLLWEPEMLKSMGQTINILASEVLTQSIQQVLGSTILIALMASLQPVMYLAKLSYLVDNPWSVSLDRAWAAGKILADTLIHRNLGMRPVTLVGFSLGARVIFSCLLELAKMRAHGLVQNVYIFGSPVILKRDEMVLASTIVSGRFLNGYSRRDWVLSYLFRATAGGLGRICGLAPVEDIDGIESFDCTNIVYGHMGYREAMPRLLKAVGWEVLSEEFTEIEDPDPDRHRERQLELLEEFEEVKRQLSQQGKKKKGLFSWMRPKKKEWWEMYDEAAVTAEAEAAARLAAGSWASGSASVAWPPAGSPSGTTASTATGWSASTATGLTTPSASSLAPSVSSRRASASSADST